MARTPQNSMDAYLDVYDRPSLAEQKKKQQQEEEAARKAAAWKHYDDLANKKATPAASTGGTTGGTNASYAAAADRAQSDLYSQYIKALKEQQRAAELQKKAQIDAAVGRLEAMRPGLKTQYEQGAQQAYIQSMLAKRDLPQQLAAQGLSGGLAESSNLALDTAYQQSRNDLLSDYNAAVNDLDSDIAQVRASGDLSLADTALEYQQKIADAALQAQQYQQELAQSYARANTQTSQSGTSKPKLTLAQAQDQLDRGNYSDEVLGAIQYYTGAQILLGRYDDGVFHSLEQMIQDLKRKGYSDVQIAKELDREQLDHIYQY